MTTLGNREKITYINPYPTVYLWYLDHVCQRWLIKPFRVCFDQFLCSFYPTTLEIKSLLKWRLKSISKAFIALIGAVVMLPLSLVGFLLWWLFQWSKQPYRMSVLDCHNQNDLFKRQHSKNLKCTFATTNLCLLYECVCRFNNMTSPALRAKAVGQRIKESQSCKSIHFNNFTTSIPYVDQEGKKQKVALSNNRGSLCDKKLHSDTIASKVNERGGILEHKIIQEFPLVDILIIQVPF